MKYETFNEFWAVKVATNPGLEEDVDLSLSKDLFREELRKAFEAGMEIPEEMARINIQMGINQSIDIVEKTLGRKFDDEMILRTRNVNFLMKKLGVSLELIAESDSFKDNVVSYIRGDMPWSLFESVCKAKTQGLS